MSTPAIYSLVNDLLDLGGPGSGYYNHPGRPGRIGGSAPMPGGLAALDFKAKGKISPYISHVWEKDYPGTDVSLLRTAFDTDYANGFSTQIKTVEKTEGEYYVHGTILKDGQYVGQFIRYVCPGAKTATNGFLQLDRKAQGYGFATEFYRAAEGLYERLGVETVMVHANIDVGGYAWARMGFDFKHDYTAEKHADSLRYLWQSTYPDAPLPPALLKPRPRAWDIAAVTGPDGRRIGKSLLLGTDWVGQKQLVKGAESRKVGDTYYAINLKHKKKA